MAKILDEDAEKFLGQLVQAIGISGNVAQVSALIEKRLQKPHIQLTPDDSGLGLIQAVMNEEKSFRVMLETHMDVVGLRINYIDERGFCFLRSVGGVDLLALKGHKIVIETKEGSVKGLIQGLPIHHTTQEERKKAPKIEDFFVRTEFTEKPLDTSPIRVGDAVIFEESLGHLGKNTLVGPGFDNRLGVLIMTEIMRHLDPKDLNICLYAVASSGEEIGCRGIRAVTQKIAPDLAIAIDVTNATNYPGANLKKLGSQSMGAGAVIARGYNTRSIFNDKLIETAEECQFPYQLRAEDITPTDGREIDEAGVPTLVVRVPGMMLHTANDSVDRVDIETTGNLLIEFLKRLPFETT